MSKKKNSPVANGWQNRIVGYGEKPAAEFKFNPHNWREHSDSQKSALNDVLSSIGWVTGVIENQITGNLIDGHARIGEAIARNEINPIPYTKIELSEDEERKILALFDPISAMAQTNAEAFLALTELIEDENSLINSMRETLEAAPAINLDEFFEEKPFKEEIVTEKYSIVLEYDKQTHETVLNRLNEIDKSAGTAVQKLLNL